MVFSGLYPADGSDFDALSHAIEKLTCNDASVSVTKETSTALGMGFRYQLFYMWSINIKKNSIVLCYHVEKHTVILLQMWLSRITTHGCISSAARTSIHLTVCFSNNCQSIFADSNWLWSLHVLWFGISFFFYPTCFSCWFNTEPE